MAVDVFLTKICSLYGLLYFNIKVIRYKYVKMSIIEGASTYWRMRCMRKAEQIFYH